MKRTIGFASASLIAALGWAGTLAAQETIFDPENPDAESSEPSDDGGAESIVDPENPGAETIDDPENPDSETIDDPDNPSSSSTAIPHSATSTGAGGGYLKGTYRLIGMADTAKDHALEDVYELHNIATLRVRQTMTSETSAVLSARFAHALLFEDAEYGRDILPGPLDDGENTRGIYDARLEEAYVSTRFDRLLLRVGQQRIVWGSSDITRPSDVVGPMDMTSFATSAGSEMTSFASSAPILAAKADYVIPELGSAQLVLIPFFEPHRVGVLSTDFSLARPESLLVRDQPIVRLVHDALDPTLLEAIEPALIGTELPDQTPANTSVGGRLSTRLGGVDLSAGYLYGWDRVPVLEIDPALAELATIVASDPALLAGGDVFTFVASHPEVLDLQTSISESVANGAPLLSATYRRWHVFTADTTFYVGPIGIRADAAFTPARTLYVEGLSPVRPPAFNSSLGLSYEGDSGELAVIVEGFWFHVFRADQRDREILFFGNDYHGVATAVRIDLEHYDLIDCTLQIGGQLGTRALDSLISAQAIYRFDGDTRLLVGAVLFNPPSDLDDIALGGLYDDNDMVFVGLEQGF